MGLEPTTFCMASDGVYAECEELHRSIDRYAYGRPTSASPTATPFVISVTPRSPTSFACPHFGLAGTLRGQGR